MNLYFSSRGIPNLFKRVAEAGSLDDSVIDCFSFLCHPPFSFFPVIIIVSLFLKSLCVCVCVKKGKWEESLFILNIISVTFLPGLRSRWTML